MSSKEVRQQNSDSNVESDSWSGEFRERWVSSAIAAATASLRASAPSALATDIGLGSNSAQT